MKTKSLIFVTIAFIIVLSGVLAYGLEQIKAENSLAAETNIQSDAITKANELARSTKDAKQKSADKLAALDTLSLTHEELVGFIELVEDTGRSMGLKVDITSVSSDAKAPTKSASTTSFVTPQPVNISIRTDGNWSASLGFIHALENLPEKVEIQSASLSINPSPVNASSTSSSMKWHTDSSIVVYIANN